MSKQEKGTKTAKFDQAERRKLWKQPTEAWIALLNTVGAQKVKDAGSIIKLQCPYHPDTNPSGTLNLSRGYYKCFSCKEYVGDPITFVNKYLQSTYTEVARTFRDHFKLDKLDIKKLDETQLELYRMKLLNEIFHRYLCNVWVADTAPASALTTVQWLKNRGIVSVDMLGCLGMLPTSADLQKLCVQLGATDEDITWCQRLLGDYLNITYMNCVVYTYAKSPDEITAFKLRIPGPDKDSTRVVRPTDSSELGAFAVNVSAYYKHYSSDKVTRFIAVEGEHDALALLQGMFTECPDVDEVVIALGGAGHSGVDFMADLGFSDCRLVGDDDDAGNAYPLSVMPKTRNVAIQIFKWPQKIRNKVPGKIDPDEAVKLHTFLAVYNELCNAKNYVYASRWCLNNVEERLKNIHPDNVIALQELGTEYTAYLKNDLERQVFADAFAKLCPSIPADQLLRQTRLKDDTPLGFVEKIREWISERYMVTTWDKYTNTLKLWNKRDRKYLDVPVDRKEAVTQFARYTAKGNLHYWASEEIGLPSYFPAIDDPEAGQSALNKCEDMIERDIQRAYRMLSSTAVDESAANIRGQGIHLEHVQHGAPGYFVNGTSVYKLRWNSDYSKLTSSTALDGPADGDEVFDLEHRRNLISDMSTGWTSLVKKPEDLQQRPAYSAAETFSKVHHLINMGFEFKNQDIDALYCTGLVFYNYLHDVFAGRRMLTHVYAQFESGKTTLLSVTSNHSQLSGFSLCDHAVALDAFTQAAFYQTFTNTRLVAALDEMNDENDGSPESRNRKLFYQRTRSLATSGKAMLSQGTVDGTGRTFVIRNSVITASGTVIHDAMDESRYNTIHLKKNPERGNSRMMLTNAFSPDERERLRLSILLHAVQLAPLVAKQYEHLYASIAQRNEVTSAHKTTIHNVDRFTENLMPMAAILDVFGRDGQAFIDGYRNSRKQQVHERSHSTSGHSLIDTILTANIPSREAEYQNTTIKAMLLMASERGKINSTNIGVYYDDVSQCLGVVWAEVKLNLLKGMQFRGKSAFTLKAEAETVSDWLVDRAEADKLGITQRLLAAGMTSSSDVCSIITVRKLIERHEAAVRFVAQEEKESAVVPPTEISYRDSTTEQAKPLKGTA